MASILGSLMGGALSTAVSTAASLLKNQKRTTPAAQSGGFAGSATGVSVYDRNQAAIRQQMNANSQAWHTAATEAERDRLHAENQALAAQLGGSVSYDGASGTWSGMAQAPAAPSETAAGGGYPTLSVQMPSYTPADYRPYLEALSAAYLARQEAALEQAYADNLSDLQAEQGQLGGQYQEARRAAAADSATARRNWGETAAAYGLNSGTAGQAQLSFANRLQSDLADLHAAESAANAEIERQRTNLGRQYRSALLQAQAENDYQLYQRLYDEAVRVDEALQAQSQFQANLAFREYETALERYYADLEQQNQLRRQQREDQLAAATLAAQAGDYSLYGQYYGWDDSRVQQLGALWQAAQTPAAPAGSGSGNSGGSGASGSSGSAGSGRGSSAGASSATAADPIVQAYEAGVRSYAAAVAYFKALGYGDGISEEFGRRLEKQLKNGQLGVDEEKVLRLYNNLLEMRQTDLNRQDPDFYRKAVEAYARQESLQLNDQEIRRLRELLGIT